MFEKESSSEHTINLHFCLPSCFSPLVSRIFSSRFSHSFSFSRRKNLLFEIAYWLSDDVSFKSTFKLNSNELIEKLAMGSLLQYLEIFLSVKANALINSMWTQSTASTIEFAVPSPREKFAIVNGCMSRARRMKIVEHENFSVFYLFYQNKKFAQRSTAKHEKS